MGDEERPVCFFLSESLEADIMNLNKLKTLSLVPVIHWSSLREDLMNIAKTKMILLPMATNTALTSGLFSLFTKKNNVKKLVYDVEMGVIFCLHNYGAKPG